MLLVRKCKEDVRKQFGPLALKQEQIKKKKNIEVREQVFTS